MPIFWEETPFRVSQSKPIILKWYRLPTCYLCAPETLFLPIPSLWLVSGGNVLQMNILKKYDEQAGEREDGKGSRDKYLSDYQDVLEMMAGDRSIPPADKIWRTMWRPERLHIRLLRGIQHRKILNIDEGSRGVNRAQAQIRSGHTEVSREQNKDQSSISDKAN